eukprot:219140_1
MWKSVYSTCFTRKRINFIYQLGILLYTLYVLISCRKVEAHLNTTKLQLNVIGSFGGETHCLLQTVRRVQREELRDSLAGDDVDDQADGNVIAQSHTVGWWLRRIKGKDLFRLENKNHRYLCVVAYDIQHPDINFVFGAKGKSALTFLTICDFVIFES